MHSMAENRARQVSEVMLAEADLVLTMSPQQVREFHRWSGELENRVRILPEYVGLTDGEADS